MANVKKNQKVLIKGIQYVIDVIQLHQLQFEHNVILKDNSIINRYFTGLRQYNRTMNRLIEEGVIAIESREYSYNQAYTYYVNRELLFQLQLELSIEVPLVTIREKHTQQQEWPVVEDDIPEWDELTGGQKLPEIIHISTVKRAGDLWPDRTITLCTREREKRQRALQKVQLKSKKASA